MTLGEQKLMRRTDVRLKGKAFHKKQHDTLYIIEPRLSDETRLYSHGRTDVAAYSALVVEEAEVIQGEHKWTGMTAVHLKEGREVHTKRNYSTIND